MTVSVVPEANELVTTPSKVAFIRDLFKGHFAHQDQLMQPLSDWYNRPLTDDELEGVVKQLCQWAGVKPRQLDVKYQAGLDASGNYYEDDDGHHIVVSTDYSRKSYEIVAILAHETTHYILESRKHLKTDDQPLKEELIDLATIYLGFGVLVANGLNRHENWTQRLWNAVWPFSSSLYLGSYSPSEYARQLGHYVGQSSMVNHDDLQALLTPWSRRLFIDREPHYNPPALYVQQAAKRIKTANLVLVGSCCLALFVSFLTIFIVKQIPPQASDELIIQREQADVLYRQYLLCNQSVSSRKANTPQPDIFTQQNINADAQRCQSLKNQYNSIVDSYNQSLTKY
jgi:hypothetical protein